MAGEADQPDDAEGKDADGEFHRCMLRCGVGV